MKFLHTKFYFGLAFLLSSYCANANLIYSVINGDWHQFNTWSTNTVPVPTDSVVITTFVAYFDSLFIAPTGNLLVDSCGTLCGNHLLTGHFQNYGTMRIGSFYITDSSYSEGIIYCNNTSANGVGSGLLRVVGGFVNIGPNMPPCIVPANKKESACARALSVGVALRPSPILLYPNPATDELTISSFDNTRAPFNIGIYSVTGACVHAVEHITSNTIWLKTNELAPGCYVLKLSDAVGFSSSARFVIAR